MKHDWQVLYSRWKTSGVTKKEFAAQRGLSYGALILAFQKQAFQENQNQSKETSVKDVTEFSKFELPVADNTRNLVIVTASGLRLEVPI